MQVVREANVAIIPRSWRFSAGLAAALATLALLLTACGDGDASGGRGVVDRPSRSSSNAGGGSRPPTQGLPGGEIPIENPSTPPTVVMPEPVGLGAIETIRLDPPSALVDASEGQPGMQRFRVLATFEGEPGELDVTDRAVFYVPENHRLGAFPDDKNSFVSNGVAPLGGVATVAARLLGPDGEVVEVTGRVVVRLTASLPDPRDDGSAGFDVPSDTDPLFETPEPGAGAAGAPAIVYPNDGTLMPPNLSRFSVHFQPGSHDLFRLVFSSTNLVLSYDLRCGDPVDGGCIVELGDQGYRMLAESNRGSAPVEMTVLGVTEAGGSAQRSAPVSVQFAQTDVTGGLYYWSTTNPVSIMRVQFGAQARPPEAFLQDGRDTQGCPGCHAISPDGRKVVASLRGQNDGFQVLVNDLQESITSPTFLDRDGSQPLDRTEALQFASFRFDGSEFVSIFGDTGDLIARNTLWFHDGDTGRRIPGREVRLPFEPSHPDWSSDGDVILMTQVGIHQTSQRPLNCGISLVRQTATGWSAPETVIPVVNGDGKSRYNPDFAPDDSFFTFSESHCPLNNELSNQCDGDADPTAKTWAAKPEASATPVLLARAAAPGIMDGGQTDLSDTFARFSPFATTYLGDQQSLDGTPEPRRAYWVTIGTPRRIGLQNDRAIRQLWMFAVDPDKVLAGEDGSFAAFHLPFQDTDTENHIGQWTREVVTDTPPPEPPMPERPPVPEPITPQ